MEDDKDVNRRSFLGQLGAGAVLRGKGISSERPQPAKENASAWTPPPALVNPNILIIMVDQMRLPAWLSASQSSALDQTVLPNIFGRIRNNSYNFEHYFANATNCSPSRAGLVTGLYSPQTALYITTDTSSQAVATPDLNPAFPTWAQAMCVLNPAYGGNVWWFGKWHLSDSAGTSATPLLPYGFNTRTYPGGLAPPYNPSPNGAPNEGTNGGPDLGTVFASDALIAGDFIGWLQGLPPTSGQPLSPWCATVSLINPHDIAAAPGWLRSSPFPPTNVRVPPVYFPPPAGTPPPFYTRVPSPWNFENLKLVTNKPSFQYSFLVGDNAMTGPVTDWVLFLNQYFWLQNFVDQQVGLVLDALYNSPSANNTIIIFMSDHGEYAGSHGLHGKGWTAYDESIRVPFCVQFPGQAGSIFMNQMCASVDFFGLICDLATAGSGQWRMAYPDLANRQSIWSFLYNSASETRVMPGPLGLPYIFHTFDESIPRQHPGKYHITCLRTKQDVNSGSIGAKLAFYWEWAPSTTSPDATPPDPEFYDYNPQTTNNSAEMGNDYFSNNSITQNAIAQHTQALGTWGPQASGLIANELNRPLIGVGNNGNPLTQAQTAARQAYFKYASGT